MVAIHFSQLGGRSVTLDGCDNTNLGSIYNVSLLEILQIVNFSFHSASMLPLTLGAKSNNLFHFISRFFRFKFFFAPNVKPGWVSWGVLHSWNSKNFNEIFSDNATASSAPSSSSSLRKGARGYPACLSVSSQTKPFIFRKETNNVCLFADGNGFNGCCSLMLSSGPPNPSQLPFGSTELLFDLASPRKKHLFTSLTVQTKKYNRKHNQVRLPMLKICWDCHWS